MKREIIHRVLSESHISQLHYIAGGDGLAAIFVKNNGLDTLYYIHTDHLGSINVITNQSGAVVKNYSFDAWGRRRNPVNWTYNNIPSTYLFSRGFTGHEHLDQFDLVNMNGRVYDPLLGRFLSPDNFVQSPDFTQSFNRYGYCLNNPLKYTDPNGNFFIIDSWLIGLFSDGWKEANKRAANDIKIWGGLFASDPNKGFFGRVWETISRFTWQLPQTIGGWGTAQAYNTLGLEGGVESVKYKYGATVVSTRNDWTAVTQGSYIVGGSSLKAEANNPLFQHEYGHYIQSQKTGWAYYPRYGLPSAFSINTPEHPHLFNPIEQDANMRAFKYFNRNVTGFYDKNPYDANGWSFYENPIDIYHNKYRGYVDYNNLDDMKLLNSLIIRPDVLDYMSWFLPPIIGVIISGFENANIYNSQY